MRADQAMRVAPGLSARPLAGMLLLAMTLLAVGRLFVPQLPGAYPGALAWLAMLLLLPGLTRLPQIQAGLLLLVGVGCAWWAQQRGVSVDMWRFLDVNLGLLALLAGVSYLRLITLPEAGAEERLPRGERAFVRTLLGTHLFAAVINLSALLITCDRLAERDRMSRQAVVPLTRAFTAAAFWSPFFAAMGVALTYAPGASLLHLVVQGLPLALLAMAYTYWEARHDRTARLDEFRGYPMHFEALWVPALLVTGVLLVHRGWPDLSVILVVSGLSLLLTVLVCLARSPAQAMAQLKQHTLSELPRMSGELTLFIAAGALSVGLGSLFQSFNDLPVAQPSFVLLAVLLPLMVTLAVVGIHPVISISVIGTWLASSAFDPNVLGTLFLSAWAIGVSISPLSGASLALIGRYALAPRQILQWHIRYALVMLLASGAVLWLL